MTRAEALRLRGIVELAADSLDDKTISTAPTFCRRLKQDGSLVAAGTRINWGGTVKKAAVDLWDTEENTPDKASALWQDIPYRAGHRIIPEVITVTGAFSEGETGWWGDTLHVSKVDNNVYTPGEYPDNWETAE